MYRCSIPNDMKEEKYQCSGKIKHKTCYWYEGSLVTEDQRIKKTYEKEKEIMTRQRLYQRPLEVKILYLFQK